MVAGASGIFHPKQVLAVPCNLCSWHGDDRAVVAAREMEIKDFPKVAF